jgi:hypothetical protein
VLAIVGQEIAEVLAPFAKWGALVAGVILLVWLIRLWIRRGAEEGQRLEALRDTQEDRADALEDLRGTRRRFRDAWRRVRERQGR